MERANERFHGCECSLASSPSDETELQEEDDDDDDDDDKEAAPPPEEPPGRWRDVVR